LADFKEKILCAKLVFGNIMLKLHVIRGRKCFGIERGNKKKEREKKEEVYDAGGDNFSESPP